MDLIVTTSKSKRKYWWEERAILRKGFFNGKNSLSMMWISLFELTACVLFSIEIIGKMY